MSRVAAAARTSTPLQTARSPRHALIKPGNAFLGYQKTARRINFSGQALQTGVAVPCQPARANAFPVQSQQGTARAVVTVLQNGREPGGVCVASSAQVEGHRCAGNICCQGVSCRTQQLRMPPPTAQRKAEYIEAYKLHTIFRRKHQSQPKVCGASQTHRLQGEGVVNASVPVSFTSPAPNGPPCMGGRREGWKKKNLQSIVTIRIKTTAGNKRTNRNRSNRRRGWQARLRRKVVANGAA